MKLWWETSWKTLTLGKLSYMPRKPSALFECCVLLWTCQCDHVTYRLKRTFELAQKRLGLKMLPYICANEKTTTSALPRPTTSKVILLKRSRSRSTSPTMAMFPGGTSRKGSTYSGTRSSVTSGTNSWITHSPLHSRS